MADPELLYETDGPLAFVTFNRPPSRNAMTWAMYDGLAAACERVDADPEIRVMILRGAGGQSFVAGTDIGQFTSFESAEDGIRYERDGDRYMDRLERVRKPVIAQIEGYAVGTGLKIAAACDLRIATPSARFGAPIAKTIGNCLSMAAYSTLLDLFGPSRTKELLFTGRLLDADEARAAGFVHAVVTDGEIGVRVRTLAEELCSHAPLTLEVTKEAVRRLQAARHADHADDLIGRVYTSADFKEGVRAFLEKRKPRWTGK